MHHPILSANRIGGYLSTRAASPAANWIAASVAVGLIACCVVASRSGSEAAHLAAATTAPKAAITPAAPVREGLDARARLDLQFEPNRGQAAPAVRYVSHAGAQRIEVFDDGLALSAPRRPASAVSPAAQAEPDLSHAQIRFVGSTRHGRFDAREPSAGASHYLLGADAAAWLRDVPRFRQLRYAELYPGIDLVYYSREGALEFDLVVRPGADPAPIRMHIGGAVAPVIADNGDLLLDGAGGVLRLHRPVLYQNIEGRRTLLDARYVIEAGRELSFALPAYDKRYPLVIDPVFKLLYSTYLGGVHDDQVGAMVVDAQNNTYIVGNSGSEDWPVSGNAYQATRKALGRYVRNVVVSKFDASGTLVYSTFLGGTTNDYAMAVAVDAGGSAYVTGSTNSADFPTTPGALQTVSKAAQSAYLAVLSPDGSALRYSTLYGGTGGSAGNGIAIDASGAIFVGGTAGPGLATTAGAYKATLATGNAAFIARFDTAAAGSAQLVAASYYGVDNPQPNNQQSGNTGYALALDPSGAPWLAGQAFTTNLPTSANAWLPSPTAMDGTCSNGSGLLNSFGFVIRMAADLKTVPYASYLTGGIRAPGTSSCSEYGHAIQVDPAGNVYVGSTTASAAFPTTAGAAQTSYPSAGGANGYAGALTKLKPDGSGALWSSYLGGNGGSTFLASLALDPAGGSAWASLVTAGGTNYPLSVDAAQKVFGGGGFDAAFTQLDATTGALKYSTYLGGRAADAGLAVAVDHGGNALAAGTTASNNFPVTPGAFQPALTANAFDGNDWFFSIIGSGTIGRLSLASAGNSGDATLVVDGAGFQPGATCTLSLAGAPSITTIAAINSGGTRADCLLQLNGASAGLYDIGIVNPDGSTFAKKAGFTVVAGGKPALSVQMIGRSKIRTGVPSRFTATVTNSGNQDAYAVPLWVVVPASVTVALDADVPGDESLFAPADTSSRRISVLIPRVLAGQSVSVGMTLTATVDVASLPLNASVQAPWFRTLGQANAAGQSTSLSPTCVSDPARPGFADCLGLYYNYALLAAEPLAGAKAPSAALGGGATILAAQAGALGARRILADSDNCNPVDSYSQGDKDGQEDGKGRRPFRHPNKDRMYNVGYFFGYAVGTIAGVAAAAGAAGGPSGGAAPNDARAQAVSGHVKALDSGSAACPVPPPPPPPSIPAGGSGSSSSSGGSIDPNDLIGPAGDGSTRHFIRNGQPFGYEIAFENQPTASLPAARVVITDRLDPAKFDLTTFRLGSIAFGSTTISVPPGLQSYATTQAIDATMSVRVQGSIDTSTGVAKWTFDTIDPLTRMTPSDPTLGFLPPDTDGRKGQGTVTFSVTPKVSLADATPVANQASIVFDANPAIATPAWSNTLDLSAPTAKVQAIRPQAGSTSFDVDWSGTDAGSGVRNYTVYVADGSAPFTPWLTQSSATTATYAGVSGHRYAFYVIGNDGAGNTEPAKSAAEASVTVDGLFAAAPAAASSGGGGGCTIAGGDRRDLSLPLLVLLALLVLLQRRYRARSQLVAYNAALK